MATTLTTMTEIIKNCFHKMLTKKQLLPLTGLNGDQYQAKKYLIKAKFSYFHWVEFHTYDANMHSILLFFKKLVFNLFHRKFNKDFKNATALIKI